MWWSNRAFPRLLPSFQTFWGIFHRGIPWVVSSPAFIFSVGSSFPCAQPLLAELPQFPGAHPYSLSRSPRIVSPTIGLPSFMPSADSTRLPFWHFLEVIHNDAKQHRSKDRPLQYLVASSRQSMTHWLWPSEPGLYLCGFSWQQSRVSAGSNKLQRHPAWGNISMDPGWRRRPLSQ